MAREVIYLDMDGVCVDWTTAVFQLLGRAMPAHPTKVPYDFEGMFGLTRTQMWERIDAQGADWWERLPPFEHFYVLLHDLRRLAYGLGGEVVFLTAPCRTGQSSSPKARWLDRHAGVGNDGYVITRRKELLARPGAVLVDDMPANVEAFRAAGGQAVLFPTQQNDGPPITGYGLVAYVVEAVRRAYC